MTFLSVSNFSELQHYRDRNPVWIKMYVRLLDNDEFLDLPEVSQRHLMMLWIVAAKTNNRLPDNPKRLAQAIKARGKVDIALLLRSGFLRRLTAEEIAAAEQADAKALAALEIPASRNGAEPYQNATLEGEGEGETELPSTTARAKEPTKQPTEHRTEPPGKRPASLHAKIGALLKAVPSPDLWGAEIDAMLEGMAGHIHATPAQLERGLTDFLASGKVGHASLRQFRNYVEGAAASKEPTPIPFKPRTNGRHLSRADQLKKQGYV